MTTVCSLYIGETDDIAARMRHHLRSDSKDFFDRVAFVVSSDEALTKAHARYLESRLIRLTLDAGTVSLTNDTTPDFQRLPEADRADMESFIDQLRLVLPLVGFDLFRSRHPIAASAQPGSASPTFEFSTGGASARARETEYGFLVLAGSTAKTATSATLQGGYRSLRDRLRADQSLVAGTSPDLLVFASDVSFASPSAAASIIAGRSASARPRTRSPRRPARCGSPSLRKTQARAYAGPVPFCTRTSSVRRIGRRPHDNADLGRLCGSVTK